MILQLPEPTAKYRPAPFWSWNADLSPDELRWQIRQMHAAGLGGFFMHARGGLQTAYLSKAWMTCVEASLDEAGKLGMDAWLYDENGWPSGFGGGLVNALGEDYQLKYLRHEIINADEVGSKERTIACYSEDGTRYFGPVPPAGFTGRIMRCFYEVNPFYVDNLDAKVVAEFIRVTHQHYYENLPENLLKHLRGIFTDEPQLSRNGLLWSLVLEEEYRKEYHDELLPLLPHLFTALPGSSQTRIRFWKLCSDLFSKAFMKQIRQWCDLHNWELTGHHVLEEYLSYQTNANGSIMPQYRYYTLPGVDNLGRMAPSNVAAVQLLSVAAQYGHKQLLTESFAASGWACNFTGMRWIYQQQMAHGINYLCQHLQSYSLRGARKRDYPQSSFYHQPWWEDYKILNDYFTNVGKLLADGTVNTEIIVIHPMSSMWKVFTGNCDSLRQIHYQESLDRISTELDNRICQYHYADEIIVDECGSCENDRLIIGKCSYRIVIIPQLNNISRKIFNLLRQFRRNGGIILKVRDSLRDQPMTIDGVEADTLEMEFFNSLTAFNSETAAAEFAAGLTAGRVTVYENNVPSTSVSGTWRKVNIAGYDGNFYYLVNNNYRSGGHFQISLPEKENKAAIISQYDGKLYRIPADQQENSLLINWHAGSADAIMLFAAPGLPVDELPPYRQISSDAAPIRLLPENSWQISAITENILTLDFCRYRIDGGDWGYGAPIDLQTKLLALEKESDLELEYTFETGKDFIPGTPVFMAVESPEKYSFALNDTPFDAIVDGYLFDKAFQKIALPENLRTGKNVINMKTRFRQPEGTYEMLRRARVFESESNKLSFDSEIESIYLCGNFSVDHQGITVPLAGEASRLKGSFSLGAPLKYAKVDSGNLVTGGLPFFAGKVTLKNSFSLTPEETAEINFFTCHPKGSNSIKVRINGENCGGAFWEPFAVPVKGKLQPGINTIEIELVISLRNMLGPHHLQAGEHYWIGTLSFNHEPDILQRKPAPSTPEYCMVDFGITNIKFTG